jgi:hypothetical protein
MWHRVSILSGSNMLPGIDISTVTKEPRHVMACKYTVRDTTLNKLAALGTETWKRVLQDFWKPSEICISCNACSLWWWVHRFETQRGLGTLWLSSWSDYNYCRQVRNVLFKFVHCCFSSACYHLITDQPSRHSARYGLIYWQCYWAHHSYTQ